MILVTSGSRYLDIDAYACCVAYAELLRLLGKDAQAASGAPFNNSVTASLRAYDVDFTNTFQPAADDRFVLADISNPQWFDTAIELSRILEVYDHHPGFEDFWRRQLEVAAHIEFIGAAATLIYERWVEEDMVAQMPQTSARLLAAAMLDNTLNFQAAVTTRRDRQAFEALAAFAGLDDSWVAGYFGECQQSIMKDIVAAIRNDTKTLKFEALQDEVHIGQLTVWDAADIRHNRLNEVRKALVPQGKLWFLNLISISEGRSYFLADDRLVQEWLSNLLNVRFDGALAAADRLWLRKEIMKTASQQLGS